MEIKDWLPDNELGQIIWEKKYRQNHETLDEWFERVSGGDNDIKQLIIDKKFLFGGRTLTNRGTNSNSSYFNCYSSGYAPDDYKGLLELNTNIGLTFKAEGGQGLSLSKLRPKGSLIQGKYKSDGIIPFMEIFNQTTKSTSQGDSRRGALLMSLDIWHKEAEAFITIKTDKTKINNANLSVEIDDEFMQCVNKSIETKEDIVVSRRFYYADTYIDYDVCPIKLYRLLCASARNSAEPGIIFTNRFRNYNLMEYVDEYQIVTGNPCVRGDTLVLTKDGEMRIDSIVGKKTTIWNGYEWSEVEPRITGHNQPMKKITFSNGSELCCTHYHKFVLSDNRRVEAKDLCIGDKLAKFEYPIIEAGNDIDNKLAYTQGFFSGDGYNRRKNEKIILLYGQKKNLTQFMLDGVQRYDYENKSRLALTLTKYSKDLNKDFVPNIEYSVKSRINWLEGIVDSDGTRNSKEGSIAITSINKPFLIKVKSMLMTLGISCVISICKKSTFKKMPSNNHSKEDKEYFCQTSYRLLISAGNVKKLNTLGFNPHRVDNKISINRDASRFITIKSIEDAGVEKNVYCFNESKNHTGVFNGIMTGQCGEQALPKNGACCLSSTNIANYVKYEYTENADLDWDELKKDIYIIVRAMDNILEENAHRHALKEQQELSMKFRNIGIGFMGIADMYAKMMMKYGDIDALELLDDISKFVFRNAVYASVELAEERGNFDGYSPKIWDSNIIKDNFTDEEIIWLKNNNKLRNCSLISCAPTGSIATMLNVSTGIEPFFALSYTRKTESLNGKDMYHKVFVGEAKHYMDKFKTDTLPDYFVCSKDIKYLDRIKTQATLQAHTDTAISSTINLPKETTVEDVMDIYLQSWQYGLKGVTIYVDGSRDAILTTDNTPKPKNGDTTYISRPKTIDADFYQVKVKGELFSVIVGLYENKPYEVWAFKAEKNIENHKGKITKVKKQHYMYESNLLTINNLVETTTNIEERASTLYSSMLMRHRANLEFIIKTAKKVDDNITSFSSAMCRVLSKYLNGKEVKGEFCPECGSPIIRENGCIHCTSCGWSKCG